MNLIKKVYYRYARHSYSLIRSDILYRDKQKLLQIKLYQMDINLDWVVWIKLEMMLMVMVGV